MIGGNFDIPIMYQDLAESSMMTPIMPFGTALNTSYLGGVQLPRQLDSDKLLLQRKDDENAKKTAKNVLTALGVIAGIVFFPSVIKGIKASGGLGKYLKSTWKSVRELFKSKPKSAQTKNTVKGFLNKSKIFVENTWQRITNGLKKFGKNSKKGMEKYSHKSKNFFSKTKDKFVSWFEKLKNIKIFKKVKV